VGFTVLGKASVVPRVAARVHDPSQGALDAPAAREDDEAFGAFGAGDGLEGDVEEVLGPGDKLAGDTKLWQEPTRSRYSMVCSILRTAGVVSLIRSRVSSELSNWARLTSMRAVSSRITVRATVGLRSRLVVTSLELLTK
jgi:hypothetical protein